MITEEKFIKKIWDIGDEIIAFFGIDEHVTDIYLADPAVFIGENEKTWEDFKKKFDIEITPFEDRTPIALLALMIYDQRYCCNADREYTETNW